MPTHRARHEQLAAGHCHTAAEQRRTADYLEEQGRTDEADEYRTIAAANERVAEDEYERAVIEANREAQSRSRQPRNTASSPNKV
jgi:hypothetical protein